MAEIVFAKVKGVQKENQTINLEEFIAVKGIKALGNQLTTDKLKQINMLESITLRRTCRRSQKKWKFLG